MIAIRPGVSTDVPAIAAIQESSPGAALWPPAEYLSYNLLVAQTDGAIAGFLCAREVSETEREILNIAVAPCHRRQGVGRTLLGSFLGGFRGDIFLEVRKSNISALLFYKSLNFQEVGIRRDYYHDPGEDGVVMKLHSC